MPVRDDTVQRDAPTIGSLERSLTRLVRLANPSPSKRSPEGAERLDRAGYAVLARIDEHAAMRLTELAASMEIDISTASRQVRALESRGLLRRTEHSEDLRCRWLALTDQGRERLEATRRTRVERIGDSLRDWHGEEVVELARLIEKMVRSFEASGPASKSEGHGPVVLGGEGHDEMGASR